MNEQYFIQPPDIPEYLYRTNKMAWYQLMQWSYREYQENIRHNAEHGHFLGLISQHRESSPIRVLAELKGFRRLCSIMSPSLWRKFNKQEKDYLIRCFELRDILLRDGVA